MTQTDISVLFNYNRTAEQLARIKKRLCENGLAMEVHMNPVSDSERPKVVLVATQLLAESHNVIDSHVVGESELFSGRTLASPGKRAELPSGGVSERQSRLRNGRKDP